VPEVREPDAEAFAEIEARKVPEVRMPCAGIEGEILHSTITRPEQVQDLMKCFRIFLLADFRRLSSSQSGLLGTLSRPQPSAQSVTSNRSTASNRLEKQSIRRTSSSFRGGACHNNIQ